MLVKAKANYHNEKFDYIESNELLNNWTPDSALPREAGNPYTCALECLETEAAIYIDVA